MDTNIHFSSYLAQFFLEWEIFRTVTVGKIKTHIVYWIPSFQKLRRLWVKVEQYFRAGKAIDEDMAQAHSCWVSKAKDTHSDYVIFIDFFTATMVARTHLNVTLYVNRLSRYKINIKLLSRFLIKKQ
jgi:hypothetical protein